MKAAFKNHPADAYLRWMRESTGRPAATAPAPAPATATAPANEHMVEPAATRLVLLVVVLPQSKVPRRNAEQVSKSDVA